MQRSRSDRELMTQNELTAKREFLETMQGVFNELDEDGDNCIELEDLAAKLQKPKIGAYFSSLGVDVDQVSKLFKLLDSDGSGNIDSEEFMFGCLKLRGEAKSLDIAILHSELRFISQRVEQLCQVISTMGHDGESDTSSSSSSEDDPLDASRTQDLHQALCADDSLH